MKLTAAQREAVKRFIEEWVEPLLIATILALVIRTFFFQPFKIPSGSMQPTLVEGDKIFVNKFLYRFREPGRGDVIVFRSPEDPKKDFIKRLVALGGETVSLVDGDLLINGEVVRAPPIFTSLRYTNRGPYGAEGQAVTVAEESFFVLGDNTESSRDSRFWGLVPRRAVVGKAVVIWWPPWRIRLIH